MTTPRSPEPNDTAPVIVVGAGITGLACAWRLRRLGVEVVCLEAAPRSGGVIETGTFGAGFVERGPTTVQGTPELLALIDDAGLEGERIEAPSGLARHVLRGGVLHALPRTIAGALTCGVISAAGKARALAEAAVPARKESAEETVEEFFARRFGREVVDALVGPFVSGTFAGDPARLSARSVFPAIVDLESRHGSVIRGMILGGGASPAPAPLTSLRGGLQSLAERLARDLGDRLVLANRVRSVVREGLGFAVESDGTLGPRRLRADRVVLTVPPWEAAPMLAELAPEASAVLAAIDAPPVVVLNLAWPRDHVRHALEGFGFLVARDEQASILGCLWPASIFPNRARDDGKVVLTCFVGGARTPERTALDDEALAAAAAGDLARVLGTTGAPEIVSITRYPRAIPQYTVGHRDRVARLRASVEAIAGLHVCGNFATGISLGECVRQGADTAAAIAEQRNVPSISPP